MSSPVEASESTHAHAQCTSITAARSCRLVVLAVYSNQAALLGAVVTTTLTVLLLTKPEPGGVKRVRVIMY